MPMRQKGCPPMHFTFLLYIIVWISRICVKLLHTLDSGPFLFTHTLIAPVLFYTQPSLCVPLLFRIYFRYLKFGICSIHSLLSSISSFHSLTHHNLTLCYVYSQTFPNINSVKPFHYYSQNFAQQWAVGPKGI